MLNKCLGMNGNLLFFDDNFSRLKTFGEIVKLSFKVLLAAT